MTNDQQIGDTTRIVDGGHCRSARAGQPPHESRRHRFRYDPSNREALWGAYQYTPEKDVVHVPMKLSTLPYVREQLTWEFLDMSDSAGLIALSWDKTMATVTFQVAQ